MIEPIIFVATRKQYEEARKWYEKKESAAMTTEDRIKELAEQVSKQFMSDTRNDGERFIKLREGYPPWMQELCFKAHGDMMPDDIRYEFILEAVDAITEAEDLDCPELEASCYTGTLTAWLASRCDRYCYVDEAVEEYGGEFKSIVDMLMVGQVREKEEVYHLVLEYLREMVEDEKGDKGSE